MERTGLTERIERIRASLAPHDDVLLAYLFGSVAKGRSRASSDVDVAVLFQGGGGVYGFTPRGGQDTGPRAERGSGRLGRAKRALALEGELERALGCRAQIVSLNDAPLGLAHNILKTGRLILSSDDEARRRFYVGHARV